jgi:HK97 family phage portal protein
MRLSFGHELAGAPKVQAATESAPVIAGDAAVIEWFGGGQQAAGVTVNAETAMRMSAVWRCVTVIAGANMTLPLVVYQRDGKGGRKRADDHPYAPLLRDQPNGEMSGPELIELASMAVLLRGNAYGLMRQARNGRLTSIDWYPPTNVQPFRSQGSIWYRFTNQDGSQETHHDSYVIHFRGPGRDADGICALSPISYHAETIGIGLAGRQYTAGQFKDGLLTNDYFQFPTGTTPEQAEAFREYLRNKRQGVSNAHNPLILTNGGEWKRLAISARDAQLIELLQYSAIDVARIFGVPPFMIGETEKSTSWGTGLEQQRNSLHRHTLLPHLVRFQKELNRKLFPIVGAKRSEFFCEFDVDAFMQGDSKSQGEFFRVALGGNQLPGFMSVDEVRRLKNLPPLPDGKGANVYVPVAEAAAKMGHTGGPPLDEPDPDADPDQPEGTPDEE